jgi:hypothetical protein
MTARETHHYAEPLITTRPGIISSVVVTPEAALANEAIASAVGAGCDSAAGGGTSVSDCSTLINSGLGEDLPNISAISLMGDPTLTLRVC